MAAKRSAFTKLRDEVNNSPLATNAVFGFILAGLEKVVELEFQCPCDPTWNRMFSSAFFVIPAIMAYTLMLIVQGCSCGKQWKAAVYSAVSSFVPAIVWLILLFLDGQYFACAMTDWEGKLVLVENAAPQKWCEPTSDRNITSEELLRRSQQLYVVSQVIGMALLICICVGLIVYVILMNFHSDKTNRGNDTKSTTQSILLQPMTS